MCARHFKLYLRTNTELFTEDFSAVFVDEDGQEDSYEVNRQNFFTGHVIGKTDTTWLGSEATRLRSIMGL